MSKTSIKIENLSTGYHHKKGNYVVAKKLSADINKGELTCLLGSNGVGKSTLLKTLCGFLPKLEGDIYIEGKNGLEYTPTELAKTLSVVLTEKINLRNMTVTDIVSMGRSPYTDFWGRLRKEDKAIVNQAIKHVGIQHLANRPIQSLSDGERQKMMIAKALAQETAIIILDEPTAFLDYPSKIEMMRLLHDLSRESSKTIFMSTHDLDLALQTSDCIWLLNKETGLHVGTPEDLAIEGTLTNFFESPSLDFNVETGLFGVKCFCNYYIETEGEDGQYKQMLKKALLRNHIQIERAEENLKTIPCKISVCDNTYIVKTKTQTIKCEIIRQVLDTVYSVQQEAI